MDIDFEGKKVRKMIKNVIVAVLVTLLSLALDFVATGLAFCLILWLVGCISYISWNVLLAFYVLMWVIRLHVNVGIGGRQKR